jgi:ribosomal protein S18 acetylase RimI-like enzyme
MLHSVIRRRAGGFEDRAVSEDGIRSADFRRYLAPEFDGLCAARMTADDVATADAGGRVRRLEWDSEFFGVPSGRLLDLWRRPFVPARVAWGELVPALVARADAQGFDFLDVRIAADELALAQALEAAGFRLVDALAIYRHDLRGAVAAPPIPHREEAVAAVLDAGLARMEWGRLFADPRVPRAMAEDFYRRTTLHYLAQGGRSTLLVEGGRPAGLAIGILDEEGSRLAQRRLGQLWLFILAPDYTGKGLGKRLFNQFCAEFGAVVEFVEIGTQIQNVPANRIYRSAGAMPIAHALTFHRWRRPA